MKFYRLSYMLLAFLVFGTLSGCGYTFQNSKSPLTEKEGIRKIYVKSIVNDTYKAGVEITVYNALLRTLSVHRRVTLVNSKEDADAELRGSITLAAYVPSASTSAVTLNPGGSLGAADPFANVQIATQYTATLNCTFYLIRTHPNLALKQKETLWSATFSRNEIFDASNQLGTQGDTSSLINESEFDRALGDLATAMMDDVHESMLAMF